ncbi:unnamed protein product [Boreogadus saida]
MKFQISRTRTVELVLVVDYAEHKKYGSRKTVAARMLAVVNHVDKPFQRFRGTAFFPGRGVLPLVNRSPSSLTFTHPLGTNHPPSSSPFAVDTVCKQEPSEGLGVRLRATVAEKACVPWSRCYWGPFTRSIPVQIYTALVE